jgi:antitoxin component HigA of HigAB toxin-antitoxin module
MAKKMIRPIRTETEHNEALEEIERYFESDPNRAHRRRIGSIFSR